MKARRWPARVLATMLATGLVVALMLGVERARAAEPYEIYVVLPLTGFAAFVGQGTEASFRVIEDLQNRKGGIRGRPIKFVYEDDQSSPQVTVQLTNQIIAKHVPVFIGSQIAAMCFAQLPIVKDGPVDYCLSTIPRPPAGSYMFVVLQALDDLLDANLRYSVARGWHKIAAIATTDTTGQDFDTSLDRELAKPDFRSMTIVDREHFNVNDPSMAAQIARVRNSGAEVIYCWAVGTSFGTFTRDAHEAGLDLPVFTSGANLNKALMQQYAATLPTNLFIVGWPPLAPNLVSSPGVRSAIAEYAAAMSANRLKVDTPTFGSWDAPNIVIAALRKYGTDASAAQIRDFIANYRGPGVLGQYDFPAYPQRGLSSSTVLTVRWDKASQDFVAVSGFGGTPLK